VGETDGLERIKRLGIATWSIVGLLALLGIALFIIYSIHTVLMPFIYALAFVYVLRPIVEWQSKRGIPRIIALILSYLGMLIAIALFGMYVGPILYREGNGLIQKFPTYISTSVGYAHDLMDKYPFLKSDQVTDIIIGIEGSFKTLLKDIALTIPTLTANIFGGVLNLVLGPIIAFYILKDLEPIRKTVSDMIPEKYRAEGMHIIRKIDCIVGGFLKGQLLVALSVAVLSGIALYLLGVDYAILLGFLIGLFNIIPYLGPIIGGIPAVIIALGTSWQLAIIVIAVLLAVQQLDSIFISPRIMSHQVNLHPAVVIFALLVGGTLFNIIGMLIAIPIAAVGKALYLHFREKERDSIGGEAILCDLKPEVEDTLRVKNEV